MEKKKVNKTKKVAPAKKAVAKKVAPVKKAAPAKKVVAKKVAPVKKAAPAKKAVAKKVAPVKKAAPAKKAVAKKAVPVKKTAPAKKAVAKKIAPVKKAAPAKKAVAKKVAPVKKAAPAKKAVAKKVAPVKKVVVKKETPAKKTIVVSVIEPENIEKTRYSDKELIEFKEIILRKIEEAQADLALLTEAYTTKNVNDTNDTSPTFKVLEEGSAVLSKEENSQLAARQKKFIRDLENALIRIENKTYGVCRVTGKLIPKERLRAVPHATLSIDAKMNQNKRA